MSYGKSLSVKGSLLLHLQDSPMHTTRKPYINNELNQRQLFGQFWEDGAKPRSAVLQQHGLRGTQWPAAQARPPVKMCGTF